MVRDTSVGCGRLEALSNVSSSILQVSWLLTCTLIGRRRFRSMLPEDAKFCMLWRWEPGGINGKAGRAAVGGGCGGGDICSLDASRTGDMPLEYCREENRRGTLNSVFEDMSSPGLVSGANDMVGAGGLKCAERLPKDFDPLGLVRGVGFNSPRMDVR